MTRSKSQDPELTIKVENYVNMTVGVVTPAQVAAGIGASEHDRPLVFRRLLYLSRQGRIYRLGYGEYQRTGQSNIEPGEMG